MAIKDLTNWQRVNEEFRHMQDEYDRKTVDWLASLGERVVKYAREHGNYIDRTGNLRNSIGYVVVQYGQVQRENFGGGDEPRQRARSYALEVTRGLSPNKTYLVWVAGMEYARYVEAKGYEVLQGSGDWVESTAENLKAEYTRFLKSQQR